MIALFIFFLATNEVIDIEQKLDERLNVCLARAELMNTSITRCYLENVVLRKRYGLPDPKEFPAPAKSKSPR
jgi:hypothetical protein